MRTDSRSVRTSSDTRPSVDPFSPKTATRLFVESNCSGQSTLGNLLVSALMRCTVFHGSFFTLLSTRLCIRNDPVTTRSADLYSLSTFSFRSLQLKERKLFCSCLTLILGCYDEMLVGPMQFSLFHTSTLVLLLLCYLGCFATSEDQPKRRGNVPPFDGSVFELSRHLSELSLAAASFQQAFVGRMFEAATTVDRAERIVVSTRFRPPSPFSIDAPEST